MHGAWILAAVLLAAAPTVSAGVHADIYHDEGRLRSGIVASADAGGCWATASVEYFDNDGDHLPDTVPPGGPPPRYAYGIGC